MLTEASRAAGSSAEPKVVSAKKRAITYLGGVLAVFVLSLGLAGGHPRSNWFYPFFLVPAALGVWQILKHGDRAVGAGDDPPKPIARALGASGLTFVSMLVGINIYWSLLLRDHFSFGVTVLLSAMAAVNDYRQRRGYAYSMWPSVVVFVIVLMVTGILKWMGVIPPHHG